jgi:hypothetical protein
VIRYLARPALDPVRWDACVGAAPNTLLYGLSWYLDVVCEGWAGLVLTDADGQYAAVMPVPLRRKTGRWVVHQPLFCQFLGVFARPGTVVDPADLYRAMRRHVRYGSSFYGLQCPPEAGFRATPRTNYVLDLGPEYATLHQRYSADRRTNLRRAERDCTPGNGWIIRIGTDIDPLLQLFRDYHAQGVDGGVAPRAYDQLRLLVKVLQSRGLATIYYAERHGQPEAGALFVEFGGRIVYLFNAASPSGRQANARTRLLDGLIRERAGEPGLLFDFESPAVPEIARFYASFGARPEPFWLVQYSRLTWPERVVQRLLRRLRR